MKTTKLISVLMPVRNGEKYLGQAIESILSQTYKSYEFIIVDDNSSDETPQILSFYAKKDKRIEVLSNKKRLYLAGSLNKALKIAKGTYIARMDADDISFPNRFKEQIILLESDLSLVAVGTDVEIIDADGSTLGIKQFPTDTSKCYRMLLNFMSMQPSAILTRASLLKKIRYDTGVSRDDDIDTIFRLLQFGKISNVSNVLLQYRKHNTSYTYSNVKRAFFMSLHVRLRAVKKYGYKPAFSSLILLFAQVLLVMFLPQNILISLFTRLRFSQIKSIESIISKASKSFAQSLLHFVVKEDYDINSCHPISLDNHR